MTKIAAVIVTYNRKIFLQSCLDSLLQQTRKVDKIFVVDNASTDGTENLIKERYLPTCSNLAYIRLSENTGGAGGFHEGLNAAIRENFDWIWLMDDDVAPFGDCLEELLKFTGISECIHPRRVYINGDTEYWEGYLDERSGFEIFFRDPSFDLYSKEWITVNYGCFEGMLVSRRVVLKIGLPNKKYFIIRDDTEFGYTASKITNVIYTKSPRILKLIDKRHLPPTQLSYFLTFRNSVGYFARKISKNKWFYFQLALYYLARSSLATISRLKFSHLLAIHIGFLHGLLEIWGGEKRYLRNR